MWSDLTEFQRTVILCGIATAVAVILCAATDAALLWSRFGIWHERDAQLPFGARFRLALPTAVSLSPFFGGVQIAIAYLGPSARNVVGCFLLAYVASRVMGTALMTAFHRTAFAARIEAFRAGDGPWD